MIRYTLADIARITGGALIPGSDPDTVVDGPAEFDSRRVRPGSLFIALPGAHVDGHDFVPQAHADGAAASLVAQDVQAPAVKMPVAGSGDRVTSNAYAFSVDTSGRTEAVVLGLSRLARHTVDVLSGADLTVVGVTGSAGKTSTKDFLATVLRDVAPTVAPPGSFNNEIGLPYTALRCTTDTRYLIAEMSARGIGHIAHLARITPPNIGVVLNVGSAHIGEFGSQDNIARAKSEILQNLRPGGVAVLNADDPLVAAMRSVCDGTVIYYGVRGRHCPLVTAMGSSAVEICASDVCLDDLARPRFTLSTPTGSADVQLQVSGEHQVSNALAAAAVGHVIGLPVARIAQLLTSHVAASAHRMDVKKRNDGVIIINDSYNANPDSMRAAIAALARTSAHNTGESWAVLGQMAELGADAVTAHEEIADVLAQHHIDHLVTVGCDVNTHALAVAAEYAGIATIATESNDAALNVIASGVHPGDTVLVKASHADGLWRIAEELARLGCR